MRWAIGFYLMIGFLLALGLYGWATVSSIRSHGFRKTVRGAVKTYVRELPLYWRVPWAAWTLLLVAPLIAAWAIIEGEWDSLGAIFLAFLWLLYFALLRWHLRLKAHRADGPSETHGLG